MSKQDPRKVQTCVLRVNIDCECDGCETKIRKLFNKIDGVYATSIDVEEGKVTVTGNVDPNLLIRRLEKSGKHAELWGSQKGSNNNKKNNQSALLNNQFKKLQVGNGKEKKTKQKNQFGEQQIAYQQSIQEIKGSEDSRLPFKVKEQKTVKFNLPGKDDGYGDFSGDGSDEDYEEDDDDDEFGHGAHKKHEALPIMGKHKKGGGGGKAKKANEGFMAMIGKAIVGKSEGKNGKGGKNKGGTGGGGRGNAQGKGGGKRAGKAPQRNRGGGGGGAAYHPAPAALLAPAPPLMMNMNGSNPYYHSEQQYTGMMCGRQQQVPSPGYYHDPVTTMFNDENTNACSIM